jgi:CDP-diglyceride synthetase
MTTNDVNTIDTKKKTAKKKTKEGLVFALIALSIVATFGGIALVSRGVPSGWIGIAAALPMLLIVARAMRAASSALPPEPKAEEGPAES